MHSKDNQKGHQIFTNSHKPQDIGRIFRFSLKSLRMHSKDNQKGQQIFTNSTGLIELIEFVNIW